jgi:hypothetical protein
MYWSTYLRIYCVVDTLHVLVCHLAIVPLFVAQNIEATVPPTALPEQCTTLAYFKIRQGNQKDVMVADKYVKYLTKVIRSWFV